MSFNDGAPPGRAGDRNEGAVEGVHARVGGEQLRHLRRAGRRVEALQEAGAPPARRGRCGLAAVIVFVVFIIIVVVAIIVSIITITITISITSTVNILTRIFVKLLS